MDFRNEIDQMSPMDMVIMALRHWLWYIISLVVCLGVAFYVVKSSQVIYKRQATVLIQTKKATSQMMTENSAFEDLGLLSNSYLVDNELIVFKSKRLMTEVARRLSLDVDYSTKGHFRDVTLYATTPVRLRFPDAEEEASFSLVMTPIGDQKVKLHDFTVKGKTIEREVTAAVGDTVNTPVGRVALEANLAVPSDARKGTDIKVRKMNLKKVGIAYSGKLQTSVASKLATVIVLTMQDTSKERAEDVLNTLVEVYNEDAISDKNRVAEKTEIFIADQLKILEGELNDVDMVIANFKATNQLTDIKSDASAYRATVSSIEQRSVDLQNQKAIAEYILQYIQATDGSTDVIPNNAGIKNSQVESLISEYNTQVLMRDRLKVDAGENNPQVQDLTNSIGQLRTRIVASILNLVQSLDIEIRNVNKSAGANTARLTSVPGAQKTVTSVERQQKIKEQLYLYLLNKQQENALAKNITESSARLIDPAMGSDAPVEPKSSRILLIGLLAGLLIPSAILWLLVVADTKVRSRKDLENLTLPLVGEIPQADGSSWSGVQKKLAVTGRRRRTKIVVEDGSRDSVSEAVRILRTNVQFLRASHDDAKVLMMTSFLPGAGKTFVSSNLAMSMALTSKKVVMVDLDIRRGSLSANLAKEQKGVTDYLCGMETSLDNIIYKTEHSDNLDIVPAGTSAPNPSELLMLPTLEKLIEGLKERYDLVILDCVPANVVADAVIVNRVADLTFFIIRAGNLDKRLLPDVERMYEEGKLKNMSLVLNGVSAKRTYSNSYTYGYGYHKYYGYSDKSKKKK